MELVLEDFSDNILKYNSILNVFKAVLKKINNTAKQYKSF